MKKWLDCNKLSLNITKTNFVIFHSPNKPVPDDVCIKFGKKVIKRVKYVKFLGILMDEHLSYKYHIQELHKKLSKTSGIFFKIRHQLSKEMLVSLYYFIFSSFLRYGLLVWGLTCESYKLALFCLLKKLVKCIHFEPLHTYSNPIFKFSKLLKLDDLLKLIILSFVYKTTNNLTSSRFQGYITYNSIIHGYETHQVERDGLYKKHRNTTMMAFVQWNIMDHHYGTIPLPIFVFHNLIHYLEIKTYIIDQ